MLCNKPCPYSFAWERPTVSWRPIARAPLAITGGFFASSITHLTEEAALGFSNFTLREDPTVGLLYFHFVFSATQELLPRNAIAPGTGALGHY